MWRLGTVARKVRAAKKALAEKMRANKVRAGRRCEVVES